MLKESLEKFGQYYGRTPQIESILYYPHPFTDGGIIVVYEDEVNDFLAQTAEVYTLAPNSLSVYCLRRRELYQLGLPGLFGPPLQVNERPHLLHWLKHKGTVIAGADLRDAVEPHADPHTLLAGHIEGCMDYLRRYGVLMSLIQEQDEALAAMLVLEMKHLMGTALLLHGIWDISLDTVADQFAEAFADTRPFHIWQQFQAKPTDDLDILETVWAFEQFLRALRVYTS